MSEAMNVDATTSVGKVARFRPEAIAVFEFLGLEYACAGGRSLREAAIAAGLDVHDVIEAVKPVDAAADEPSLADLIHAILADHLSEQQRIAEIRTGLRTIAARAPEWARLRRLFDDLHSSVVAHMRREERDLFEPIEELEARPHRIRPGSISRRMFAEFVEHDVVHERLVKARELVLRLRGRRDVDQELLDKIDAYDRSAHRHMHLENNVLIPRVLELENRLRAAAGA
jgi:regulator of cell morphogenesis and NO signaling